VDNGIEGSSGGNAKEKKKKKKKTAKQKKKNISKLKKEREKTTEVRNLSKKVWGRQLDPLKGGASGDRELVVPDKLQIGKGIN